MMYEFVDIGAGYGTFKAGAGIAAIGIWKPDIIMKSLIPVVMAGILGIYGMIVAVLLSQKGMDHTYQKSEGTTYIHLQRRLRTHGIRIMLWFQLYCSRCSDRNCRRCRSKRKCIARQAICGAYFDSNFCRSTCSLWIDRVFDLIANIGMINNNNA